MHDRYPSITLHHHLSLFTTTMSYEPHLVNHVDDLGSGSGEQLSLLDELDKIGPIKSFDAFPKVGA